MIPLIHIWNNHGIAMNTIQSRQYTIPKIRNKGRLKIKVDAENQRNKTGNWQIITHVSAHILLDLLSDEFGYLLQFVVRSFQVQCIRHFVKQTNNHMTS